MTECAGDDEYLAFELVLGTEGEKQENCCFFRIKDGYLTCSVVDIFHHQISTDVDMGLTLGTFAVSVTFVRLMYSKGERRIRCVAIVFESHLIERILYL